MKMTKLTTKLRFAAMTTAALLQAGAPLAADELRIPPVKDPVVAKECGACHMVYPAGLLPAKSWSAMTANLGNHFGDNAELDAATTKRITDYLTANAAETADRHVLRGLKADAVPERITDLPSWKRKHEKRDRVAPAALVRAGAKFKGDCKACHKQAERGIFEDDD
jgi:cytochrome c2